MNTLTVDELIVGDLAGAHIKLQAGKIEAVDETGTTRLHLYIERGGTPAVELHDGNGTARIHLGVVNNGCPFLVLRDGNQTPRLELMLDEDEGDPSLRLYDRNEAETLVVREGSSVRADVR